MAGKPANFEVLLTEGAEQDLELIHDYIAEFDCVANADRVLNRLMKAVESLSRFPERGSYPKELRPRLVSGITGKPCSGPTARSTASPVIAWSST